MPYEKALIEHLLAISDVTDWKIAIHSVDDDVDGIVIGKSKYVEQVVEMVRGEGDFSIVLKPPKPKADEDGCIE